MKKEEKLPPSLWEMIKIIEGSKKFPSIDLTFTCPNVVRYLFKKNKKALVIS